jgi:catechol 2,3-dioxygenase-like lactoylglutathione lyase family enzyme
MKITLHHINLATDTVADMDRFYRDILGMGTETSMSQATLTPDVQSKVSFVTDGGTQFHLSERDLSFGFRARKAINPLERGHIAFRTDDLATFKACLEQRGIPYADFGDYAVKGWQQIFFHDPAGNIIEMHQVDDPT